MAQIAFERGDMVIVIYDVPKQFGWIDPSITSQTSKMNVWYGVAATSTTVQ
jgi:hypothetical protein